MPNDRMFHVIVLGGMALVGVTDACGGGTTTAEDAGGSQDATGEFPSELPSFIDSGHASDAAIDANDASTDAPEEFPSELPSQLDSGGG